MIIAITSDNHFNLPKRSEEAKRILRWMLDDWKSRGVDLIGFAGDLADGPMTERDRAWLIDYITDCANLAPVVAIEGNHDIALSLRNALGHLATKYPVIVEDGAGVHVVESAGGAIAVPCVSFPHKAQLLATVGRPVSNEEADEITGQALQDIFRGLGVAVRESGLPSVALIHGTIKGSKISLDDQPDRPLGLDIALPDLCLMGADFYGVGHIHARNEWKYGEAWVCTPTCPFYADFGEAHHDKGYLLVTVRSFTRTGDLAPVGTSTKDLPRLVEWERIPTPATPMLLLEANYTDKGEFIWSAPFDEDTCKGADVRLRFSFASDQRKAAQEAAAGIAGLLRVSGAANVTLDPIQIPTTRARIPALATTSRLEDKVLLYWKATGFEPGPERQSTLVEMLHELQEQAAAAGLSMGTAGRAAPTLKKVRMKGWFKFPDEVVIEFDKLESPLTAIVAPNETGKTVLMQLIGPGVLFGTTATRGTLNDLAIAKDSYLEVTFDMGGAEYVLTQNCNGVSRTGSVSLLKNGERLLDKAGRDEYKQWADKNLIPKTVYDAVICQSGTDSIIDLDDAPRVQLLLKVLGLEIYEALAEMARKRTTAVSEKLAGVRARLEELGTGGQTPEDHQRLVAEQQAKLNEEDEKLTAADKALADERRRAVAAEAERVEYRSLVAQRDELGVEAAKLRARAADLESRLAVHRETLVEAPAIEKAVADVARLEEERDAFVSNAQAAETELGEARVAYARASSDVTAANYAATIVFEQIAGIDQRIAGLDKTLEENQTLIADAESIRAAVAESQNHQSSLTEQRKVSAEQATETARLAGAMSEAQSRLNGYTQRQGELQRRHETAVSVASKKTSVLLAVERLTQLESEAQVLTTQIQAYRTEIETLQRSASTVQATRIDGLRGSLQDIKDQKGDPVQVATEGLDNDEAREAEAADTPETLDERRRDLNEAESRLKSLLLEIETGHAIAATLPMIEAAAKTAEELAIELEEVSRLASAVKEELAAHSSARDALQDKKDQTAADIRWLQEQMEQLEPTVGRAELLNTAEPRIQALREQREQLYKERLERHIVLIQAEEKIGALEKMSNEKHLLQQTLAETVEANNARKAEYAGKIQNLRPLVDKARFVAEAKVRVEELTAQLGDTNDALDRVLDPLGDLSDRLEGMTEPETVDLTPYEAEVATVRARVNFHQVNLATAQKDLEVAQGKEGRRRELASDARTLEQAVSNWTLLAQTLGRDGLQKEEVSCAGPQLTDKTNDLLRAAGDTRHTVSIETEKLHSNKKQMIPTLDIMVFDSEEGISKESRRLSDAGKVLVGEPFGLAMILLACERAGIKAPTIFRDEATGAMDSVNSGRYMGTLHRFAELLEARVLFISQNPAMWDLAESRLVIDSGRVTGGSGV